MKESEATQREMQNVNDAHQTRQQTRIRSQHLQRSGGNSHGEKKERKEKKQEMRNLYRAAISWHAQ